MLPHPYPRYAPPPAQRTQSRRPCREGFLAILFPTESQLAGLKRRLTPVDDYLRARGLTEAALF